MCAARVLVFEGFRSKQQPVIGQANDGNCWYYFGGVSGHAGLFGPADALVALGRRYLCAQSGLLVQAMAKLGVRTVDELVGRTDLLQVRRHAVNGRAAKIDLSGVLANPWLGTDAKRHFDPADVFDFKLQDTLDLSLLEKKLQKALEKGEKARVEIPVSSTNRTLGTILGSDLTRKYSGGLADDTITVKCNGGGGQSFGAFIPRGLTLELEGDSNDYFGKGLSGGKLIVYPPKGSPFAADENIIIGNVALYGATSGKAFVCGVAGERFCVRNSGAIAVVEGVGDHGCEYMALLMAQPITIESRVSPNSYFSCFLITASSFKFHCLLWMISECKNRLCGITTAPSTLIMIGMLRCTPTPNTTPKRRSPPSG